MLTNDDELVAINAEFLGPTGYTFPWRARYSAYGVAITLGAIAYYIIHRLGLPINVFTIIWAVALVILATRAIGKVITHETPLRAVLVMLWHETSAPRPPSGQCSTFVPAKVKIKRPKPPKIKRVKIKKLPEPEVPIMHVSGCSDMCQFWLHDNCPRPDNCMCYCHARDLG